MKFLAQASLIALLFSMSTLSFGQINERMDRDKKPGRVDRQNTITQSETLCHSESCSTDSVDVKSSVVKRALNDLVLAKYGL